MYRHQRKKVLIEDLIPSGEEPWVYESTEILEFVKETLGEDDRTKINNVHAPTDLTYLIKNEYDIAVSAQAIGGVYDAVNDVWEHEVEVGDPVDVAAGEEGYIDVFPGNPYMRDYKVELTFESLGQGEDGVTVTSIFVIDQ